MPEPIRQRVAALRARDEIDDHRAVKLEPEPAPEQKVPPRPPQLHSQLKERG